MLCPAVGPEEASSVKLGRIGIILLLLPVTYALLNGYFQGGVEDLLAVMVCGDLSTKPVVPTFDLHGCGFDLGNYVLGTGIISVLGGVGLLIVDPPRH